MSSDDAGRPQDVGRPHRRTAPGPTPETLEILERYRGAMRDELGELLEELRPDRAQLTIDGGEERIRPVLADRVKLWDLAIKIGRELAAPGAGLEDLPPAPASTRTSSKPARAPRLSARERKALGG